MPVATWLCTLLLLKVSVPLIKKLPFFYHTLSFAVKIADIQTRNHRVTVTSYISTRREYMELYTDRHT